MQLTDGGVNPVGQALFGDDNNPLNVITGAHKKWALFADYMNAF